jgi:hypothetical protein
MKNLVFHSSPTRVRVTVMGNWDEESQMFNVTTSRCSAKDTFIKKKGVQICHARMQKGRLYTQYPYKLTGKEFVEEAKVIAKVVRRNSSKVKSLYTALVEQEVNEMAY